MKNIRSFYKRRGFIITPIKGKTTFGLPFMRWIANKKKGEIEEFVDYFTTQDMIKKGTKIYNEIVDLLRASEKDALKELAVFGLFKSGESKIIIKEPSTSMTADPLNNNTVVIIKFKAKIDI